MISTGQWHAAVGRACPPPGADQEPRSTCRATVKTRPRQPPPRLPPQESEICRFESPRSHRRSHFASQVLRIGLNTSDPRALNSPAPALQTRLMDVAGPSQTLAASLDHSAFNIANALGAWLGGVCVAAKFGWTYTGPLGACLAAGGLLILLASGGGRETVQGVSTVRGLNAGASWSSYRLSARIPSGAYRSPMAAPAGKAWSIAARSAAVNTMSAAATFSSR